MPTFKKDDWLEVVPTLFEMQDTIGLSLYEGDILRAAKDSFDDGLGEIVELVENSDGEPCTVYKVEYFKLHICTEYCGGDKGKIENGKL